MVVVGAGPVGLMLSTCLVRWGYKVKHIDNRAEPTITGRADGIQPRSLDLLRNMGLKSAIMAVQPAKVYEVAFWDPSKNGIARTGSWPSCPKFIDARYPFTTLLHQGYIEKVFLADMEKNGTSVQRSWTITGFENNGADPEYPVEVNLAHVEGGKKETVRTKYLFGGEGARSFVREQLKIPIRPQRSHCSRMGRYGCRCSDRFPRYQGSWTLFDPKTFWLTRVDEMHNSLRCWLYYGHSTRGQHGPPLHTNRLLHRPRFQPSGDQVGTGSYRPCEENTQAILASS